MGPSERRRHLFFDHPTDAVPGPQIIPVPTVPSGPRSGFRQGKVDLADSETVCCFLCLVTPGKILSIYFKRFGEESRLNEL